MIKTAMILAAGLGVRMRPLTNTCPKPLIKVAGKSMLARTFDHLSRIQVSHIVVNTHYLAPLIQAEIRKIHPSALISHEELLLETGGGIKKALPLLGTDPFLTLNGDSIWIGGNSLEALQGTWDPLTMDALLLLTPRSKAHGYEGRGNFFMDGKGRLSRVPSIKGSSHEDRVDDDKTSYVYIGVQLVTPNLFNDSPDGPFSMNLLWDKALSQNRLYGYVHQGEWFHISTPEDLQTYEPMIRRIEKSKPIKEP